MFVLSQVINNDKWHGVIYIEPSLLPEKLTCGECKKISEINASLRLEIKKLKKSQPATNKDVLEENRKLRVVNNLLRSKHLRNELK